MSFQPLPYLWKRQIERTIAADWLGAYAFELTVWWTNAGSTAPRPAPTRGRHAAGAPRPACRSPPRRASDDARLPRARRKVGGDVTRRGGSAGRVARIDEDD